MKKAAVPKNIPPLLKHVTMAVFAKGFPFEEAFLIGRGSLTRQGHLNPGSELGPVIAISLTGKGQMQNAKHSIEKGNHSARSFDSLYMSYIQKRLQKEAAKQLSLGFTTTEQGQAAQRATDRLGDKVIDPVTPADRKTGLIEAPPVIKATKPTKMRPSAHPVVLGTKAGKANAKAPTVPRRGRVK